MSISYPPSNQTTGSDTPINVPYTTSPTTILAANPNRASGGFIINNANRILWVTLNGLPATAAAPSIPIPASGGALDLPGNYQGAVNGIWATGGSGTATIHEFSLA
jgi:hypothetical protein